MMNKILIISPQSGMGNRLRAMAAAIVLAKQIGRKIYHAWTPTLPTDTRPHVAPLQRLGFDYFIIKNECFLQANKEEIPLVDICFSEWLPGDGWYKAQSTAQQHWDVIPLAKRFIAPADRIAQCRAEVVLLETSHAIKLSAGFGGYQTEREWIQALGEAYTTLIPHPGFLHAINQCKKAEIGIHIRRGDMLQYFSESRQDLSELLNWAFALSKQYSVAIFSDDKNLRDIFFHTINQHGGHIVDYGITEWEHLPAWESAYLEFLYLALNCKVVCGTPASSFSKEASIFGQKPYFPNLCSIDQIHAVI